MCALGEHATSVHKSQEAELHQPRCDVTHISMSKNYKGYINFQLHCDNGQTIK